VEEASQYLLLHLNVIDTIGSHLQEHLEDLQEMVVMTMVLYQTHCEVEVVRLLIVTERLVVPKQVLQELHLADIDIHSPTQQLAVVLVNRLLVGLVVLNERRQDTVRLLERRLHVLNELHLVTELRSVLIVLEVVRLRIDHRRTLLDEFQDDLVPTQMLEHLLLDHESLVVIIRLLLEHLRHLTQLLQRRYQRLLSLLVIIVLLDDL
jgi:hypothetical protein